MAGHHYLRDRTPVGAQLRYLVRSERTGEAVPAGRPRTSAAWKMAAREGRIGCSVEERTRDLSYLVNSSCFLILP